jgi:ComF family protein
MTTRVFGIITDVLLTEKALALLAPHDCLSCGSEGALLCALCAETVFDYVPSRCYRCMAKTRDSAVCPACRHNSPLKHVWVATEYGGIAKELVRRLKFERAKAAHRPIADYLVSMLPYLDGAVITHIPTATSRERARGYDQSELVARAVAGQKKILHTTLLTRHGQTRQVGATRQKRQRQAAEMFNVRKPELIGGARILLVDDILTTGASLEAAARVLKDAGAKQVDAVVFAQKH